MLAAGQTRKTQAAIKSVLQQNTQLSPLLWNLTNYFTIPTSISIDKNDNDMFQIGNNYIDKDSLEISLYS